MHLTNFAIICSHPLPRHNVAWIVDIVLNYLQTQEPLSELALTTHKFLMLQTLLSRQRGQTLQLLDIRNISM